MDEEFESFIVDPNLTDPELDISGLRTTTDTRPELLFDLPEFSGIQVDPTRGSYVEDMYRAYSGQIPMLNVDAPIINAPLPGGGGSGGGGNVSATINTPEEQRLIDEGIGLQIAPGQPVFAPGEEPVTQDQIDAFNQIPVNTDYTIGSIDPVDDAIATTGLLPGIEFDPDTGTYDEANLIEGNQYNITAQDPTNMIPQVPTATVFDGTATLEDAGGVTAGIEDLGFATDFYGDPNEDLIERGAVPEEGGLTDRGRGQITTDEFDVTTDQFTGPTMADIAGPVGFTGAPIQTEDLQTIDGEPIGYLGTLDTPPNIVMAKDPEGVVDPFGGKYTMSTAITPKDTEQSIKGKVADFLGVTEDQIDMAGVNVALNLMSGKIFETGVPIASIVTQGVPLVKEGIDKIVDIFTGGDDEDTTTITGVNPFDTADFGPETGEFDTIPTPPSPPQDTGGRGGGADRDPPSAPPSAPKGPSGPPSVISRPAPTSTPRGGGADRDPAPSAPSRSSPSRTSGGLTSSQYSAFRR